MASDGEAPEASVLAVLQREPAVLRHELAALESEMLRLSTANRGVFLRQCACTSTVFKHREAIATAASSVSVELQSVAELAQQFAEQGAGPHKDC